jgi:hypothetical protein
MRRENIELRAPKGDIRNAPSGAGGKSEILFLLRNSYCIIPTS